MAFRVRAAFDAVGRRAKHLEIWSHKGLRIHYLRELDGSGRSLVRPYLNFFRTHVFDRPVFGRAFEWCSGPAFIGFSLLAEGICERLCLADINPIAVETLRRT